MYVEGHGDHFDMRIDLPSGQKTRRRCMPPTMTRAEVTAEAQRLKKLAWDLGATLAVVPGPAEPRPSSRKPEDEARPAAPPPAPLQLPRPAAKREPPLTIDRYTGRWLSHRRDPREACIHLRCHLLPAIDMLRPMTSVTRADCEAIVRALDAKAKAGAIRAKTATNIWGTWTKILDDACNSKDPSLRVWTDDRDSPAARVRGPDRGEDRQSSYLFPREAEDLLGCEAVPIRWRIVYAVALYSGIRQGELAVLRVADVILDGGYFAVHKARDRATGGVKSTKGKRARRVPIEPELRPLLVALTEGCERDAVLLDVPPKQKMADELRAHLRRAGLTREELFASDDDRRPLSFHDLRHTFAVWLAMSGAPELTIQSRLGHASADMTQHYINEAEAVGHGDVGKPFGPLPVPLESDPRGAREGGPNRSERV